MIEHDVEGKELFSRLLEWYNFTDIKISGQFDHWDISAIDKEGCLCYFELKKRKAPHNNLYGDTIIEKLKFNHLMNLKNENTKVFVVNIFLDDILTIIPIEAPSSEQTVWAQKTNNWDTTKVKKTFISYPNKKDYLFKFNLNNKNKFVKIESKYFPDPVMKLFKPRVTQFCEKNLFLEQI